MIKTIKFTWDSCSECPFFYEYQKDFTFECAFNDKTIINFPNYKENIYFSCPLQGHSQAEFIYT